MDSASSDDSLAHLFIGILKIMQYFLVRMLSSEADLSQKGRFW
jgi:hypothetical protein